MGSELMKSLEVLPDGYKEIFAVYLQKNKGIAVLVNVFAVVIMLAMVIPMNFYIPITTLFDMQDGIGMYLIRFVVLMVSIVVYMILHELVHGITMKLCGTKRVKYGFTGMYAFAGSDDYYDKRSYLTIALAPVVVWGIVLAVLNFLVPLDWFWVVYSVQIGNISGAAGDLYVTARFSRLPADILVKDIGVGMAVYSKEVQ